MTKYIRDCLPEIEAGSTQALLIAASINRFGEGGHPVVLAEPAAEGEPQGALFSEMGAEYAAECLRKAVGSLRGEYQAVARDLASKLEG